MSAKIKDESNEGNGRGRRVSTRRAASFQSIPPSNQQTTNSPTATQSTSTTRSTPTSQTTANSELDFTQLKQVSTDAATSTSALVELIKSVDKKIKELETTETRVRQPEAEKTKELETRETRVTEKTKELETRETRVKQLEAEKTKEWKERETKVTKMEEEMERRQQDRKRKVDEMTANTSDLITLNVGGTKFMTSKQTLLRHKGSKFEALVQDGKVTNGEVFIDHDPKLFGSVLNFMREDKVKHSDLRSHPVEDIRDEFLFFDISCPLLLPPAMVDAINEWLPNKAFELIYMASIDGPNEFHNHCDDKGPTLTIIQSQDGHLFGGYSPDPWKNSPPNQPVRRKNPSTFIFTLSNPHSIPPTRYLFNEKADEVSSTLETTDMANFGIQLIKKEPVLYFDILVLRDSYVSVDFPRAFIDTTGIGEKTFTGKDFFKMKDCFVYTVKPQ